MKNDKSLGLEILNKENLTCVLMKNDQIFKTQKRGIAPLISWLEDGISKEGFSAFDKVVGKAAAFLYVLLKVKFVYAITISKSAKAVFEKHSIPFCFENECEYIINRDKTGKCPMEQTVWDIDDENLALTLLKEKLENLKK